MKISAKTIINILLLLLILLALFYITFDIKTNYVAWESWSRCYLIQHQPATIKSPVLFRTLSECESFVKKDFYH